MFHWFSLHVCGPMLKVRPSSYKVTWSLGWSKKMKLKQWVGAPPKFVRPPKWTIHAKFWTPMSIKRGCSTHLKYYQKMHICAVQTERDRYKYLLKLSLLMQ